MLNLRVQRNPEEEHAQVGTGSPPRSARGTTAPGTTRVLAQDLARVLPGSGPLLRSVHVTEHDSPVEREADEIAASILADNAQACPHNCPDSAPSGGGQLMRRARSTSRPAVATSLPELGSSRTLEAHDEHRFSQRLGMDLSGVRVHTDERAATAAATLDASAFTLGSHIAFATGTYAPHTAAGRDLLAHELAHVAQQSRGVGPPVVARRGPLPRAVPRPPPLRVTPRPPTQAGTGVPSRTPVQAPYHQQYAMPDRFDNSWHAMMWRASEQAAADRAIWAGEQPQASLQRGGTAPDFTTVVGRGQAMIGTGRVVSYDQRRFHILDAIEHEVARAGTDDDLAAILMRYLPDSLFTRALLVDQLLDRQRTGYDRYGLVQPFTFRRFDISPDLDPGAAVRLQVFATAVRTRVAAAPQMRRQPMARRIAESLLAEPPEQRQGPCNARNVPRRGGHAAHDAYALRVTGSRFDHQVDSPEGLSCIFDGLDPHNQLWEVKTGYRYFSEANIIWSPDVPRFHELILDLEEQRARCSFVAARCGYPYAYAFDNEEVAAFMRTQWGGVPPVYYIPPR